LVQIVCPRYVMTDMPQGPLADLMHNLSLVESE
jgi:hypothetical protein